MASLSTTPTSSKGITSPLSAPPIKRRKVDPPSNTTGCTILLTGLAKSGKSTISNQITRILKDQGVLVKQLDGKELRKGLCKDFDGPLNRSHFVHLASEAAKLFTNEGFITIISIVAPLSEDRKHARESHERDGLRFLEVLVDRSRAECDEETGGMRNVLLPIDANYEPPTNPDIRLHRSGHNVDALTRELVDELVAYKLIALQFMPPPQSPLTPLQPTPSPSTTLDSSGLDLDDNSDDEEDNVKFHKPQKGTPLLAIFDYVKNEMLRRRFVIPPNIKDNDNFYKTLDKSPIFFEIMNEWKVWHDTHTGEERFYPVQILQPLKSSTPTKSPKTPTKSVTPHQWSKFIPLQWDGTTIKYDTNPRKYAYLSNYKCTKCWRNSGAKLLCTQHSTTMLNSYAILRDDNDDQVKIHVAIMDKSTNKPEDWNLFFKQRKQKNKMLNSYMSTNPDAEWKELFSLFLPYADANRLPLIQTAKLSTTMIILFRNQERVIDPSLDIQHHQLLNHDFLMEHINLPALEITLKENGITFTTGKTKSKKPPLTSPLVDPTTFTPKLPSIYLLTKPDHSLKVGIKYGIRGGGGAHSNTNELRGEVASSETLYQTHLTPEQLDIVNYTPLTTPPKSWTEDEVSEHTRMKDELIALHKQIEADCRRKETMGMTTLVIAAMKKEFRNGHAIVPYNKNYEGVLNTAEAGDREYMQELYKYISGRTLTITVTPNNNVTFNADFFN